MTNYQHILVAIDFSGHSETVLLKAQSLAAKHQAKLSMVHVLDNIPMPDTSYGSIIPLHEDSGYELLEAEKTKLKQLAMQHHIPAGQCWLVWGQPKEEVPNLAEQQKVDLIVLGSHGTHGLALLLGSTANSVIHHALCDVLAVRLQDEIG